MMERAHPHATFRDELFAAGVLIPSGVDGVYGRSAAFEEVVEGMEVADMLSDEYGTKPQDAQNRISTEGNKFLLANFPKLDYIKTATVEK